MKKYFNIYRFWGALMLLIFASCNPTHKITSNVKPTEVTDLQLFKPFSYIELIERGNKAYYNEYNSEKSCKIIVGALKNGKEKLPITDEIDLEDSSLLFKLNKEIINLTHKAYFKKKKDSLSIPPLIDSILEVRGKRFGLLIFAKGFSRTTENYENQVAKGIAISVLTGILTMGSYTYYSTPYKCSSSIEAIIVDAKNNNVAFYRKIDELQQHPLNKNVLANQLFRIFNGYFYKVYK